MKVIQALFQLFEHCSSKDIYICKCFPFYKIAPEMSDSILDAKHQQWVADTNDLLCHDRAIYLPHNQLHFQISSWWIILAFFFFLSVYIDMQLLLFFIVKNFWFFFFIFSNDKFLFSNFFFKITQIECIQWSSASLFRNRKINWLPKSIYFTYHNLMLNNVNWLHTCAVYAWYF